MLTKTAVPNGKASALYYLREVQQTNNIFLVISGFTAIANKVLTPKWELLVSRAADFIKVLPWGSDYEVDLFRKPNFTALELLNFTGGGE